MKKVLFFLCIYGVSFSQNNGDVYKYLDQLSEQNKYAMEVEKAEQWLKTHPDDVGVLWRLARAHFDVADQTDDVSIHKEHFYPGFEVAKKALELDPNSARANHWYAVLIGKIGLIEGTEQKIINSYEVEKYAKRAIELDPNYDGTYHVMGQWHFNVADLSWFERTVADLVYATPPEGSFQKAADYFQKAIGAKNDEIRHYLWLAKSLIEMDKEKEAKNMLEKAVSLVPLDDGDKLLKKEAQEILEDL